MKYIARPYQSQDDLYQIGKLIRRAYARHKGLNDLLQLRGYTRSNDSMIIREKVLADTPPETISLPPGYSIRVRDQAEWTSRFEAVQPAPLNVRGLHLNVLNDQDQIAAFCSVWLDRENNIAEFEPVGMLPQSQKQGLGAALLAYACNHLREMNCPRVTVASWSESIGANKLYSACGLMEHVRLYNWKKDST